MLDIDAMQKHGLVESTSGVRGAFQSKAGRPIKGFEPGQPFAFVSVAALYELGIDTNMDWNKYVWIDIEGTILADAQLQAYCEKRLENKH